MVFEQEIAVSSAEARMEELRWISFMYIRNNMEHRIEPWGTPHTIF